MSAANSIIPLFIHLYTGNARNIPEREAEFSWVDRLSLNFLGEQLGDFGLWSLKFSH